jgi:glycosyltransferase involved in cell wall biosynthesis
MMQNILFFADRLPPLPGGMEVHAGYFIDHFTNHPRFPISGVITKNLAGEDCKLIEKDRQPINIKDLSNLFDPSFIFFNSGRWIEKLQEIRTMFPRAAILYRTGGNEIIKAPLIKNQISDHSLRQAYWATILNTSIDLLITNSAYTEARLREVGIICPFSRVVGGVNTLALKTDKPPNAKPLTIFCAARFVPYKNHSLLLSVIHNLILRGHNLRLRFAGDGPLLAQIQEQVNKYNLNSVVEFLGVLDNKQTCQEIAQANLYVQLSTDQLTEVPGGSYTHSEGMGRSILEALTAGTFVVAGRSGALPEVVSGERGLIVDLDNLGQITDKIEKILKDPPPRLPFSDNFSWANIFKHYEKLFEGLNEYIADH